MTIFIYLCLVAEMIYVNLKTIHLCAKPRYSSSVIFGVLLVYSILLVGGFMAVFSHFSFYGNGNGSFVLAGFLYLLPLKYLYDESLVYIFEVLCSAWIYTMFAFILSVHTAKLFTPELFPIITLTIQTLFYICCVPFFWQFVREKFVYVLRHISPKIRKYLRYGSLLWFFSILAVNISFVPTGNEVPKIIALSLLSAIAWISYLLIYELTISNRSAKRMEQMATTDHLTKLPNRLKLWADAQAFIRSGISFAIFYIDLNNFKSINDKHGHLAGDRYLMLFTEKAEKALGGFGTLYRISGDEFLFFCPMPLITNPEKALNNIYFEDEETGPFLGISLGTACYPKDADTFDKLLAVADKGMYKDKHSKRNSNPI